MRLEHRKIKAKSKRNQSEIIQAKCRKDHFSLFSAKLNRLRGPCRTASHRLISCQQKVYGSQLDAFINQNRKSFCNVRSWMKSGPLNFKMRNDCSNDLWLLRIGAFSEFGDSWLTRLLCADYQVARFANGESQLNGKPDCDPNSNVNRRRIEIATDCTRRPTI